MEMEANNEKERQQKRLIGVAERAGFYGTIILSGALVLWQIGLLGKLSSFILMAIGALLLLFALTIVEIYG